MIRRMAAAAAVAIALAGGGSMISQPAHAAVTHTASMIGDPASKDVAGYQDSGRLFRYVEDTWLLPSNATCKVAASASPQGFGAALTLGPAEESNAGVPRSAGDASTIGISMVPSATGCGLISPSFASNLPGGAPQFPAGAIVLSPGDRVTLHLYYDQSARQTQAVITDNTTGHVAVQTMNNTASYGFASVTAGFGAYDPLGYTYHLFGFDAAKTTTYRGNHGTLAGLGTTSRITMTSDGTSSGVDYADASALSNGGAKFGIYIH